MMEAVQRDKFILSSVNAEPSESSPVKSPAEPQKSMAFTIQFTDEKDDNASKNLRENFARYAFRHTRNLSLSGVGEDKKNVKMDAVQAIGLSPLPSRKFVLPRRAGYHSEGYFSSDQEEDLRSRSDIFVRKLRNVEKGIRATNLAQEKKILADHSSQAKAKLMSIDKEQINNLFDGVSYKRHNNSLSNINSPYDEADINCKEEWLVASTNEVNDFEIRVQAENPDEMIDDIEEIVNDSSNDTVSEAGTYTIERDVPCPEEDDARKELENVIGFMKIAQEKDIDQTKVDQENGFKMSLYRDNPNWINEWATQVAKHNHETEFGRSDPTNLPPLPLVKHQVIASKGLPPSGRKLTPSPQRTRSHTFHSPVNLSTLQDIGQRQERTGTERHSDSSLETESFLRTTESVVTAMQARMTLSMDSGGESDVDTSQSYGRTSGCDHDRITHLRRPSNASDSSIRLGEGRQSDSSSETGDGRAKAGVSTSSNAGPQTRYNRAFSLRRARLDFEPDQIDTRKHKVSQKTEPSTVAGNKPKKPPEPLKSVQSRLHKAKSPKQESPAFSRTDSGRVSIRAPKQSSQQVTKQIAPKKDLKKNSAGRSNSTLSSREVEFQNWKRRKSYDPMKAAAEGKKKEAAKKASPLSNSMTQSSIAEPNSSPSLGNPVLRSASFHGTGEMTPSCISSEEEVTLSADEDSPVSAHPYILTSMSPVQPTTEDSFGGSRVSLHSTTSNSSLRGRSKPEVLDNLIISAVLSLSKKVRGSSCKVLKKLRYLYEEDSERSEKLSDVIDLLENIGGVSSPQNRSPSKDLSATLKSLKCIDNVFKVLDEVLFDDEDFGLEDESYQAD